MDPLILQQYVSKEMRIAALRESTQICVLHVNHIGDQVLGDVALP
jgi:hypothetical protein